MLYIILLSIHYTLTVYNIHMLYDKMYSQAGKVRTSNLSGKTKSKHPVLTEKFNLDRANIMFL